MSRLAKRDGWYWLEYTAIGHVAAMRAGQYYAGATPILSIVIGEYDIRL